MELAIDVWSTASGAQGRRQGKGLCEQKRGRGLVQGSRSKSA